MNHELVKNMTIISQLIEMGDEETLAPLLRKSKDVDTEGTVWQMNLRNVRKRCSPSCTKPTRAMTFGKCV